jgi:hypothetical protein
VKVRGLTLLEALILIVVLVVLVLLFLPPLAAPIKGGQVANCGSNLSQMCKSMYNYSITKSPLEGAFPDHRFGSRFWMVLYETGEVDDPKVFICPVMAGTVPDGKNCDYRGPKSDPNPLDAKAPIGCDKPEMHGPDPKVAMNWVAKSGDVHKVPADAARWAEVLEATKD